MFEHQALRKPFEMAQTVEDVLGKGKSQPLQFAMDMVALDGVERECLANGQTEADLLMDTQEVGVCTPN